MISTPEYPPMYWKGAVETGPLTDRELELLLQAPIRPRTSTYWAERFPVARGRLNNSRKALSSLAPDHVFEQEGKVYPWRLALSPATGLPAFLRTWLDQALSEDDAEAQSAAASILTQASRAQAVFGEILDFAREFQQGPVIKLSMPGQGQDASPIRHFTWRQVHRGIPVLGGGVRVHEGLRDRRVSITSSYFPVADQLPPAGGVQRPGLLLLRALQAVIQVAPPRVRGALLLTLIREALTRWDGGLVPLLDVLLASVQGKVARELLAALRWLAQSSPGARELLERLSGLLVAGEPPAEVSPVPIHGSYLAILPFDSGYHLIGRVRVQLPGDDPWYADVDMHTGEVLGEPWQAVARATAFHQSSEEVGAGLPTSTARPSLPPGIHRRRYRIHDGKPAPTQGNAAAALGGAALATLQTYLSEILDGSTPVAWNTLVTAGSIEATNVAVHAQRLFEHLTTTCGVEPASLQGTAPGLRAQVNSTLRTGFVYDSQVQLKDVRFQHDPGPGLSVNSGTMFQPAHDPEVILHEFTHAFLWLLNAEAWEGANSLPFSLALHEGYAMYLPRSIAAREAQDAQQSQGKWAHAAYRDWGERWKFDRQGKEEGADLLPAPNTYPEGEYSAQSLRVYDVGMVWARTLWDLRKVLGPDTADFLAVQAFPYLHGYIANFELAAEALLEADVQITNSVNLSNGTQPIWAGRGIAAGQGVHGFAEQGGEIFAASDAGVLRHDTAHNEWVQDSQLAAGGALTGVVAIVSDGSDLYAAAQLPPNRAAGLDTQWDPGVFKKTAMGWEAVGHWAGDTGDATPLVLLEAGGTLVAGTSRGVYIYDGAANRWQPVVSGSLDSVNNGFLSVGLAAHVIGSVILLQACTPTGLRRTVITSPPQPDWRMPLPGNVFDGQPVRPTAIVQWQGTTCVGTLKDGLWRLSNPLQFSTTRAYDTRDAILALAAGADKLYLATDKGVFASSDGNTFTALPGQPLPADVTVISLYAAGDGLLAGTLSDGIWRHDGHGWEQLYAPETPASMEMAAGTTALLSIHRPPESPVNGVRIANSAATQVVLRRVAQPGFPLRIVSFTSNGDEYTLDDSLSGWIILLLENQGGGSVEVAMQPQPGTIALEVSA